MPDLAALVAAVQTHLEVTNAPAGRKAMAARLAMYDALAASPWIDPVASPPPLNDEFPKSSGWVLVKTEHGRQYVAELNDWAIYPEDDGPDLKWTMAGRDGYSIDDVTGWTHLPAL